MGCSQSRRRRDITSIITPTTRTIILLRNMPLPSLWRVEGKLIPLRALCIERGHPSRLTRDDTSPIWLIFVCQVATSRDELPTCLTPARSMVVSRAAKLLGYRLYRDLSRTYRSPAQGGLACSRLASRRCPAYGVARKRYVYMARSRNALRAQRWWRRSDGNGGACAHEGANRGRSPQSVGRRRGGRRSHRRAPRACFLRAGPRGPEVPRALGDAVSRASP